jgi:hypothetical protein
MRSERARTAFMRRLLTISIMATALAALALPASAHDISFTSGVTIHHPSEPTYRGRVFSDLTRCQRGRKIELYSTELTEPVATTKTNERGRWRIDFSGKTGYYAKVKRKVYETPGGGHRHVCKADTSRTI